MPPLEEERTLTDADIAAIVKQAENAFVNRFYNDFGKGVWAIVWKAIVLSAIGIAVYGSAKGFK